MRWNYAFGIVIGLALSTVMTAQAEETGEASTEETTGQTGVVLANEAEARQEATLQADSELDQFGFGPALYVIRYDDEVLRDAKDVSLRGDGSLSASGSDYSVTLGLEVHYDFSFGHKLKCYSACENSANWNVTSSHRISPFLGLFDVDNGINGIAVGLIYGYTKGDGKGKNRATLNFGIGKVFHKDRLVLAGDVQEGAVPPAGLNVEDYTSREDVEGVTLMISANIGFGG